MLKLSIGLSCEKKHRKYGGFFTFWQPFCVLLFFAKVEFTRYRMLTHRFEFSTHKLCKNKWMKNYTQLFREENMFLISVHAKYKYFHVRLQYVFIKKYSTFININSTRFQAYTHLGSENMARY